MSAKRLLLPLALVVATGQLAPAASAATSDRCSPQLQWQLPRDPTEFNDSHHVTITRQDGPVLRNARLELRRGERILAHAPVDALKTSAVIDLGSVRVAAGRYQLRLSGQAKGCGRIGASKTVRFTRPSLPVRVAPLGDDDEGKLPLLVRRVGPQAVSNLRLRLVDTEGHVVARARERGDLAGQQQLALALGADVRPGRYLLRSEGFSGGRQLRSEQPLVITRRQLSGQPSAPPTGLQRQTVVVDWSAGAWQGREAAGFVAPGIGYGEVVCRPDGAWLRFYPTDLRRQQSMMTWTYKSWDGGANSEKALREADHTVFSGPDFREGLNKFGPPEKRSTGSFEGLISDRGPLDGSGGPLAAPTSLQLSWEWDFTASGAERCHVEGSFVSQTAAENFPLARSAQVAWQATPPEAQTSAAVAVPGLGTLSVSCPADLTQARTVTVETEAGAQIITREGSDDFARSQSLGPVVAGLPNNGILRLEFAGGQTALIASRWKVNDPDPTQNFCYVSAQVIAES